MPQRLPVMVGAASALAVFAIASSASGDPPAPPSAGALALAQGLVVARRGDDPKTALFDYDPARLASQLGLPQHWQEARLVAAARAVGEADRQAMREALAGAYAATLNEAELRLEVVYAESPAGRAEVEKDDLLQAREADLAATYWPAYRRAYEGVACRALACPPAHYPAEPTPPTDAPWPAPSPEAIASAERYFQAADIYQRPAEGREPAAFLEVLELRRANRSAAPVVLARVEEEALKSADAAIWPDYRRDMARLYAATFSAAELDGMAAKEASPAFKAIAAKGGLLATKLMAAWVPVQRRMLADTKGRFCHEVGCLAQHESPRPDNHGVS